MAKPATFPKWAEVLTNDPISLEDNRVAPSAGKQNSGFIRSEVPPRQDFNWNFWMLNKWIEFFDDELIAYQAWVPTFVITDGGGGVASPSVSYGIYNIFPGKTMQQMHLMLTFGWIGLQASGLVKLRTTLPGSKQVLFGTSLNKIKYTVDGDQTIEGNIVVEGAKTYIDFVLDATAGTFNTANVSINLTLPVVDV